MVNAYRQQFKWCKIGWQKIKARATHTHTQILVHTNVQGTQAI